MRYGDEVLLEDTMQCHSEILSSINSCHLHGAGKKGVGKNSVFLAIIRQTAFPTNFTNRHLASQRYIMRHRGLS